MKQRLRQVGTKQERVGVTMCVHVRAQCLRGRDRSCSLSAWLNKRGHERISEDRPECSSAISLVPPQNTSDRHGLQKKEKQKTKKKNKRNHTHTHTTGQPEETNTTNVEISKRLFEKLWFLAGGEKYCFCLFLYLGISLFLRK